MSISLLPEFDADGYQVEPSTEKINEIIAAVNESGGGGGLIAPYDYAQTVPMVAPIGNFSLSGSITYYAEADVRTSEFMIAGIRASFGSDPAADITVSVYSFDGTTFTLEGSSPATAVDATGVQTIALSAPVTIPAGTRLYFGIGSTGAMSLACVPVTNTASFLTPEIAARAGVVTPPATMVVADLQATNVRVWMRSVPSV